MARILIIGYGNTLRGDDGFGRLAAERLYKAIQDPEIEIVPIHQLTPELMLPISRAERVLFIDARDEGEPGDLRFEPIVPEIGSAQRFSHISTPAGLLAGARALYGSAAEATLATAAGLKFGIGDRLSPAVDRALDEFADLAREWIAGKSGHR